MKRKPIQLLKPILVAVCAALLWIALIPPGSVIAQQINRVEYFYNNDPGYGAGTIVEIDPPVNHLDDFNLSLDITALPDGFHSLMVRTGTTNGKWSLNSNRSFYKYSITTSLEMLTQVEYFFDTDPGFGQGTQVLINPADSNATLNIAIDITSLSNGIHYLFVRAKDEQGRWSLTSMRMLYKFTMQQSSYDVAALEYFFDTDPGFGNGTPIPISPGSQVTITDYAIDITSLVDGFHHVFFRAKNEAGFWSLTNIRAFYKKTISTTLTDLVAAEYFFNSDPGLGLGTSINLPGNSPLEDLIVNADITSLDDGFHHFYVRTKDSSGKWSLTGSWAFYKKSAIPVLPNINYAEYFIDSDPGLGQGIEIPIANPGPHLTDIYFEVDVTQLIMGNHMLYMRVRDDEGRWSLTLLDEFCRSPKPNFSAAAVFFGTPTTFVDLSEFTDEFTQYFWDVDGNGTTDYTITSGFNHLYAAPGVYNARLILISQEGCSDTIVKPVYVYSCTPPSNLHATNITTNSAILNWTPANIETTWNIMYGPVGFEPDSGTLILNVPSTSYLLSGLAQETSYDFYVQSVCGVDYFSAWAGPATFETLSGGPCSNPTDGGQIASSQSVCSGGYADPFTSVSPASGYVGDLQYKWQWSSNNFNFNDIPGAVYETYTHMNPITATIWFRRLAKVTCQPDWSGAAISNVLQIDVDPSGQYRTKASGNWNNPTIWEKFDGLQWVDATDYPGENAINCPNPLVTILAGHTVTVTANVTFGGIVVNFGGTLTMQDGVTLTLPASTSITIHGTLIMHPTALINGAGNFVLVAGCTMYVGSAQGIHVSGLLGNIQVTGTINYAAGVHYIYFGGLNQITGDGIAQYTPASITINNTGFVVTLSVVITVSGDINIIAGRFDANNYNITLGGNWYNTGTFIPGTGTVYFNCSVNVVVSASEFYNVVFGGSGTVTATGALIIYGNVTINYIFAGGSYTHYVYGSWYNYGTYVYGTSTIYFACTVDVYVSGGAFYNVVFAGTGTVTATGSITFYGYVNVVNHFYAGTYYHVVYGNWTVSGTFIPGSSSIEFQGSNNIVISATSFYNVAFSGSGTNTASGPIVFYGNVTINSHFDAGSYTHVVYGNWTVNGTFVYGTSTIDFHGSGNALIGTSSFYNVIFCGTGTNTATGPLTFYGNVLITWHFNAGSFTHVVHGNWTVTGTFVHGTSTIDFHGSGNALIGTSNFYNVIFCGTGTNTATGPLTIYGNVLITWHFDAGSFTHLVYGNWTVTGTFVYGTSTIDFHGSGNALIGTSSFYNVIFCGTGTNTATGPLTIYGNVLISWHFNAGSFTHVVYGNWTVTGTFVHGTSTIDFHGSGNALIGTSNFYNVIFCGTGTNTATGSLTFYGNVLITWHFDAGSFVHYAYGNWTNNAVFIWGTSTIHFVGSVNQIIGGSNNTEFYGFVVNCPGGITLQQNITIHFNLTLTMGIIYAGSYTVTVMPVTTLTGGSANAYISGKLICGFATTGSRFFPVGKGGLYRPVTYNCVTLTGTSMVEIELILQIIPGTLPPNITTVNRYWAIAQSGGSGIMFQLTCNDEDIIPCCYVRMLRSDGITVTAYETEAPDFTNKNVFSAFGIFSLGVEACNDPETPVITGNTTICAGESIDLGVLSGNLNDAEEWVWYADACGQNQVGTGLLINVTPQTTTTYYVRGESSCIVTGPCASVTITVDPLPEVECPEDICARPQDTPFELGGGLPLGGTYSGTGVSMNIHGKYIFNPAVAGLGAHTITYSYTDVLTGCVNECNFTINVGSVTENLLVEDLVINASMDTCFAACKVITVSGSGKPVVIQNGGVAEFAAGLAIHIMPGTVIHPGAYAWFRIETEGNYCENSKSILAMETSESNGSGFASTSEPVGSNGFNMYPNPTTGRFVIEFERQDFDSKMLIVVYSLIGERITGYELAGSNRSELNISEWPDGFYVVKVTMNEITHVRRLVKTGQ